MNKNIAPYTRNFRSSGHLRVGDLPRVAATCW